MSITARDFVRSGHPVVQPLVTFLLPLPQRIG